VSAPDGAVLLGAGLGLVLVALHVVALLPRLSLRNGLLVTAGLTALGLLAGLLAGGFLWLSWPLAALAVGHAGWWRGATASRSDGVPRAAAAPASTVSAASAPDSVSADAPNSAAGSPSRAPLPRTLGRYRIDAQIGRGAMGAVYLGHDPQIGRQVAVKTLALSREFEGDKLVEARQRFFREAETAGRLQHPDIVTIFDAGEAQDLAYIAMEFIKGRDLQRHTVRPRLLPLAQVLAIVARVADALAYAHGQGVVHRDIKPANVMVDLDTGLVKVTDFGVARVTDSSRTRTGLVLGTPSFMSPEQMAGRRADGRSDLYSLGVMLFQLLTGELPHQGQSMAKLMHQIANEPAPDVRSLRPELPEALANVVALALEKRPEMRYPDGRQFAADLRAIAEALEAGPADAGGTAPIDVTVPEPAPAYEKTVTFSRDEPRHNPEP